ncbi:cobalamin B12-binding domain-containing protein [Desulfovibrio inopinatus]|uniref:cobalamin B12-binding domain-containing protein n=1 Tax=Desulfovibrio inopinatus TaxID=102109 RepID=UPI00040057E3|nr:cobalamin-dependent protein [Desulfovibrio inopinatus]
MLTETTYQEYLGHLIFGRKRACVAVVTELLDEDIDLHTLYIRLFQRSLYEIGALWETGKVSVAIEHMATAITEHALTLVYPRLFQGERIGKSAIVACVANEYHQIGAKMVADVLELHGWDAYFLGVNTPVEELLTFVEEKRPDAICLSLSIYFNFSHLVDLIKHIRERFPTTPIWTGGQAFRWGGTDIGTLFPDVTYIPSLSALENFIQGKSL